MKRFLTVILASVMLFGVVMMTSCEEMTAVVVSDAIEKTAALDSYEAKMTMNISMNAGGMDMSIPMTYDIKAKGMQGDSHIIGAKAATKVLGIDMLIDIYSDGEWSYVTTTGETMGQSYSQSFKQKLSAEDVQYDIEADVESTLQQIPEELLKDVEFTKNEDGSKTVSVVIPDETFKTMYNEAVEEMGAQAGATDLSSVTVTNATVTVTVADGYVKSYKMSFDMTMSVEGISVTAKADTTIEFSSYNEDITIAPPSGYESFEDLAEIGF